MSYNDDDLGTVSFTVSSQDIPDWVKNNARWWSSTSISDSEFIDGLEHLIDEGILIISPTERSPISERIIPDWIKNNARWWASDQISDEEFLKSIQHLIKKGIIRI